MKAHRTLLALVAAALSLESPETVLAADQSDSRGAPPPVTERAAGSGDPGRDGGSPKTLFGDRVEHGAYGAPETKMTAVLGGPAILVGAQGGWIVNHAFVLGVEGAGLVTRHEAPEAMRVDGHSSTLEMGYGGLRLGYLLSPASLVHAGFGLLIGGGGLAARTRHAYPTTDEDGELDYQRDTGHHDAFFVLEPQVEAELNVVSFMRIAVAGSYRVVGEVESAGLTNAKLSAPAVAIALRFGAF
jgi:hypothetical protein